MKKPTKRRPVWKAPKPQLVVFSRCGLQFDGDPANVSRLRSEHEARCTKCQRDREGGNGEEE